MDFKSAAAYIRVSTEDQTEYSPDAQLRELKDYASAHQMLLCKVYSDEGISGRRANKRPGFMQMISDAKSKEHPFDVILVHKFDRFARNREDSIVYKSMLKRSGVEVISIKEPLAEGSYAGVMEAIYESFAEAYSINLGQEVRKGMTEKALRGEPQTAPPFGYRLDSKRFTPHETEAPVVRALFLRYLQGDGFHALAHWLNAQGLTTHRGTPFENRTVEYILRNPVYAGLLRWNPKRRTRRAYDDPDILLVAGKHEPIVDKEIFDTVQRKILEQKSLHPYHGRPNWDRKHWLCGIVRCAACGSTLIFSKPHSLVCNGYVRGRCRSTQRVALSAIEQAFLSRLQQDLLSSQELSCSIFPVKDAKAVSVQRLAADLDRTRGKQQRLTDAYLNGAFDVEEFTRLRANLDAEIRQKEQALSEAKATLPSVNSGAAIRSAIEATLRTLVNPAASIAEKYDAAFAIVDRCTFDKSQMLLAITYRLTF